MLRYYIQEGIEGSVNIKQMYKELNGKYFSGALPNIKIAWNARLKKAVGRAYVEYRGQKRANPFAKYMEEIPVSEDIELDYSSLKIDISKGFDLQLPDVEAIMLHEQVHVLLYTQRKLGNHHDSPEFQNWIKKLSGESGLLVPMREAEFKASPKLQAKDGFLMLIWDMSQKVGVASYSINFVVKKWLLFAETMGRFIGRSSKLKKLELYRIKHPIIASESPKRALKSISWTYIDEDTEREIQRKGQKFMTIDKQGGGITPSLVGIRDPQIISGKELRFDNKGQWTNAQEVFK